MSEDKQQITSDSDGFSEHAMAHDNAAFTMKSDGSKAFGQVELQTVTEGTPHPEGAGVRVDIDEMEPNLRRDRPHSASQMSRRTTSSTKSRASLSPSIIMTEYSSGNMFSYRDGVLDQSIAECKKSVVQEVTDGEFKAWWLLTEIDHWDLERERIIILTAKTLLLIKFDFIGVKPVDVRRIELQTIEKLTIGDIIYPSNSFMPARNHGGLRIHIGKDESSVFQRWNPWCQSLPYVTLTHHLLIYNKHENETATFNVEDLAESLLMAVNESLRGSAADNQLQKRNIALEEETILIESYASVTSMIYNQSKLGFNLERGGVSY